MVADEVVGEAVLARAQRAGDIEPAFLEDFVARDRGRCARIDPRDDGHRVFRTSRAAHIARAVVEEARIVAPRGRHGVDRALQPAALARL